MNDPRLTPEHFPTLSIQSGGLGNAQSQQFGPLPGRPGCAEAKPLRLRPGEKTAHTFSGSGPARGDLAAAHLRGQVEAERFANGVAHQVQNGVSALRETPSLSARLETQALHGEIFTVYEVQGGWAWGQCALDGYVGYVCTEDLTTAIVAPTHRVTALRTIQFPFPDPKSQPHA